MTTPNTKTLADLLLADPNRRRQVVVDCSGLVDAEVASKSGLGGLAIKGAYGLVKKIKPSFVGDAVDHLVDEFVAALEPMYQQWSNQPDGSNFGKFLDKHPGSVADRLLQVTDHRAAAVDNRTLRSAYEKLRPMASKHVEAAVPALARLVAKYS